MIQYPKILIVGALFAVLFMPAHVAAKNKITPMISNAPSEEEYGKREAILYGITPNSPAQKAGMQKGDVIISVNGTSVETIKEAYPLLESARGQCALTVKRGNSIIEKKVIVPEPEGGKPPRFGFNFTPDKIQMSLPDEKTKALLTAQIGNNNVGIRASVDEMKDYYRVWVVIKNFGKKDILAPYGIVLKHDNGTLLKMMTPQEILYAAYGGKNVYIPPAQPITNLPTSYTMSSTTTVTGNMMNTQGIITPNDSGMYAMQEGLNNLTRGMAIARARSLAENSHQDEVWLNNNYLRNTTIAPNTTYKGVVFFAKGLQDADGIILTVSPIERVNFDMSFIRSKNEGVKKTKRPKR